MGYVDQGAMRVVGWMVKWLVLCGETSHSTLKKALRIAVTCIDGVWMASVPCQSFLFVSLWNGKPISTHVPVIISDINRRFLGARCR